MALNSPKCICLNFCVFLICKRRILKMVCDGAISDWSIVDCCFVFYYYENTKQFFLTKALLNFIMKTYWKNLQALADIASGKKKVLVPYRDSVLTKLLQKALGGNRYDLIPINFLIYSWKNWMIGLEQVLFSWKFMTF